MVSPTMVTLLARLLVTSTLVPLVGLVAQQPGPRALVEVVTTGPAQMQQLLAMDLDLAGCRAPLLAQRRIEVIASAADVALLTQAGFVHRVLVADLEQAHAAALAASPAALPDGPVPAIGQGAMGGHFTFAEMLAILDDLTARFPQLCSARTSIGQSIQGRDLWMVKISDNVGIDENEPEVLFDALHHAREPLSMGATLLFLTELLEGYGIDPEATFLIDERELFVVPCVNPDGYEHNRQTNPNGGGMWRKNRRANAGGSFGVDLNRNYATFWNAPNGGSSTSPTSETYRGTAPFSEPEAAAMDAFASSRDFVQVFSTHTYTDVLLRPWAYATTDPPNVGTYQQLGAFLVQENGIAHGRWGTLLYISSGTAVDHHHAQHGSLAWTAELGRSNEGGFWPVGPTIATIARRHQPMFRKVALTAGAAFRIASAVASEAPGSNGNQRVDPGETAHVVVSVQNVGVAPAPVLLTLTSLDAGVVVGNGAASAVSVAGLGSFDNQALPLTFTVAPTFAGTVARLQLVVSGEGRSQELVLEVPLVEVRVCVDDDFELARGFARGAVDTATTGRFERAVSFATSNAGQPIQPGTQTTPGGSLCWVTDGRPGTTATTYDVDAGLTDLLSPTFDLRHLAAAEVAFDLWFAESVGDDPLLVQLSRDGGVSHELLLSLTTPTAGWQRVVLPLRPPLTDAMQVRIRAQDQFASLVEVLIDGFAITAVPADGAATLLGLGALGSRLRLGCSGPVGGTSVPIGALGLGPPTPVPGVSGVLLLDIATAVLLPTQVYGSSGYTAVEIAVPAVPTLVGAEVAFQQAWLDGSDVHFGGNTQRVTLQ